MKQKLFDTRGHHLWCNQVYSVDADRCDSCKVLKQAYPDVTQDNAAEKANEYGINWQILPQPINQPIKSSDGERGRLALIALHEIRQLDFERDPDGRADFYSGAPKFVRAWLIADEVIKKMEALK